MVDFVHWSTEILPPAEVHANHVPFTRSGGMTLGGLERVTRTDRGFWTIMLEGIPVATPAQRREWNLTRVALNGRSGLIAVPVWSFYSAPYVGDSYTPAILSPHDDETGFDDGSLYRVGSIQVHMAAYAPIGATTVVLRNFNALTLDGIRFSYEHALYETGSVIEQVGIDEFRLSVFPAIRAAIPGGAALEVDEPTCLCRLQQDSGMDQNEGISSLQRRRVAFVEAVDVWNDIAALSPVAEPVIEGAEGLDFRYIGNSQNFPLI